MSDKARRAVPFLVAGMLVTGSINTIISKLNFGYNEAEGCCGWQSNGIPNTESHHFSHPWFVTWVMFIGEFICIIPFFIGRSKNDQALLKTGSKEVEDPFSYIFALPTLCDLTATTLGNVGLLWVDASIWQMMRGAIIIFGAILSLLILRRRLYAHHWIGVSVVVVGLSLVGMAGVIKNANSPQNGSLFIIGIVLVICAQLIQAFQMIVEELLLKTRKYDPLNVVFMEGFWGVTIMSFIALPLLYFVSAPPRNPDFYVPRPEAFPVIDIFSENMLDAFTQLNNQKIFLLENLIFLLSISFYNFFGLSLTRYLSTVHRTLIDACRTVTVWFFQIFLYWIGLTDAGEQLGWWSILQLAGFMFLVAGTIIYNEVVKLPFSTYVEEIKEKEESKTIN